MNRLREFSKILLGGWTLWKRFGRWMGDQVARIVLTLFYFTIALPFGLGVRLFADPFGLKTIPAWVPRPDSPTTLDAARNLF